MSREIVEAVRELEREKSLESGVLVSALRDGLLRGLQEDARRIPPRDGGARRRGRLPRHRDPHAARTSRSGCSTRPASARSTDLERIEEETGERQHTLLSDDDLRSTGTRFPRT